MKGLKRLPVCWFGCPNRPPVLVPKPPEAVRREEEDDGRFQVNLNCWVSVLKQTHNLVTRSKRVLILAKGEAGIGGGGAKQAGGGAGRGGGSSKKPTCPRSDGIGRTLPARLVVLQPQLLQKPTEVTCSHRTLQTGARKHQITDQYLINNKISHHHLINNSPPETCSRTPSWQ